MNSTNHLATLVEFEKQTKEFVSEPHPHKKIGVRITDNDIDINIDGTAFTGKTDRPMVHRLGNYIFRTLFRHNQIQFVWDKMLREGNVKTLESKIEHALRNKCFTVRYFEDGSTRRIYGIYTERFVEVNQLEFREEFMSAARSTNLLEDESEFGLDDFGNVVEMFPTSFSNNTTNFECILKYGRNNGYSAYQINYGREIVVCTNGLVHYGKSKEFKWIHTQNESVETFVQRVLALGVQNQIDLESQMQEAALRPLDKGLLESFLENLKINPEYKFKIREQLTLEVSRVGETEWALSQALTNIATHDEGVSELIGNKLRNTGTKMISTPLEDIVSEAEKWNAKKNNKPTNPK